MHTAAGTLKLLSLDLGLSIEADVRNGFLL